MEDVLQKNGNKMEHARIRTQAEAFAAVKENSREELIYYLMNASKFTNGPSA